jgi:hypothetical protein
MSPFEQGYTEGQWTPEQLVACGFPSAEACLAYQEDLYQEEMAYLALLFQRDPAYAVRLAELWEGMITGTRQSLRRLLMR